MGSSFHLGHNSSSDTKEKCCALNLAFETLTAYINMTNQPTRHIVQELCESRGGRPGLSDLTSLLVSVDVKIY